MMEELRRFIMVDNHGAAVKVGDLEKSLQSLSVVKLHCNTLKQWCEGADELTFRSEEETADGRLPVDEYWHAICCQAMLEGVEGAEWETLFYNYAQLHKAVSLKKRGISKKAKALWSVRDAKAQIDRRTSVRQALWEAHMKNPEGAVEEA